MVNYNRPWEIKTPSRVRTTNASNADWHSIPWEEFYEECLEEQNLQVAQARDSRMDSYKAFLERKEQEHLAFNPEEGSCEQNLSEEFPYTDFSGAELFSIRRKATEIACTDFLSKHNFKQLGVTYLNQITKYLSEFKLTTVGGEDYNSDRADRGEEKDLIDPIAFYKQVFNSKKMLGLYNFLMIDTRSLYLDKQYTAPGRTYCSLVPTVLMAFKLHKMVPYYHWDKRTVSGLINPKLYAAMSYDGGMPSRDDIMSAREIGLLIKSGKDEGKKRSPISTHKLYGTTPLTGIPELTQVMLAQIWCAHPNNRTKYMVLDPTHWDKMPQPLIETEVLVKTSSFSPTVETNKHPLDLPWQ